MADEKDTPVGEVVDKPETANPAPETTPPPVKDPDDSKDDIRDMLNSLTERVAGIESVVQSVVVDGETDSVPGGKKPWTHRRFF